MAEVKDRIISLEDDWEMGKQDGVFLREENRVRYYGEEEKDTSIEDATDKDGTLRITIPIGGSVPLPKPRPQEVTELASQTKKEQTPVEDVVEAKTTKEPVVKEPVKTASVDDSELVVQNNKIVKKNILPSPLVTTEILPGLVKEDAVVPPDKKPFFEEDKRVQDNIAQQKQDTSFDGFKQKIISGNITSIGDLNQDQLESLVEIADPNAEIDSPEGEAQTKLEAIFESNQSEDRLDIPFQDIEGKFSPSDEARKDEDLYQFEKQTYDAKRSIAKIVRGKTSKLDTVADARRVEQILIDNITTGGMFRTFIEVTTEAGRGLSMDLPMLLGLEGVYKRGTALPYLFPGGETYSEKVEEKSANTERLKGDLRKFVGDNLGITTLSSEMNNIIKKKLLEQVEKGEITKQDYDRITTMTTTTADGKVVTADREIISPEIGLSIINDSIDQLDTWQQVALSTAEFALLAGGFRKLQTSKALRVQRELRARRDNIIARGSAKDATDAEKELATRIAGKNDEMVAAELYVAGQGDKIDLKLLKVATNLEEINKELLKRMAARNLAKKKLDKMDADGIAKNDPEYLRVDAEYQNLKGQVFRGMFGKANPYVTSNLKESLPYGTFTVMAGNGLQDFFTDSETGESSLDTFTSQGLAALFYNVPFVGGRSIFRGLGRGANYINMKLGDIKQVSLEGVEDILSASPLPKFNEFIRGRLANRNISQYNEYVKKVRNGQGLTLRERRGLDYVFRLTGAMDDTNRRRLLNSMKDYLEREDRIIKSFPESMRADAEIVFRSTLAQASGISYLKAAEALALGSVDRKDFASLKNIDEAIKTQTMLESRVQAATYLLDNMAKKLRSQGMSVQKEGKIDPKIAESWINNFRKALENSEKKLIDSRTETLDTVDDLLIHYNSDPNAKVPRSVMRMLKGASTKLNEKIHGTAKAEEKNLNVAKKIHDALSFKIDQIKAKRKDIRKHRTDTSNAIYDFIDQHIDDFVLRARVPFIKLDNRALVEGKVLDAEEMIKAMMGMSPAGKSRGINPDTGEEIEFPKVMSRFFSKEGVFFSGRLGKQIRASFNEMVARSMTNLNGSDVEKLKKLHSNPLATKKNGSDRDYYIGPEGSFDEMDMAMWYKDNSDGAYNPFLATPREFMEIYGAFKDYAVKLSQRGDDSLSRLYDSYGDTVDQIFSKQWPSGYNDWLKAREGYQAERFDRIRSNGELTTLGKLLAAQEGPVTVAAKTQEKENLKAALQGRDPKDVSDVIFKKSYKGTLNPVSVYDDYIQDVSLALQKGDEDALSRLEQRTKILTREFGGTKEGNRDFFDLDDPNNASLFNALSKHMTELAYSNALGSKVEELSRVNKRLQKDINDKSGGYDWERFKFVEDGELQKVLNVKVRKNGRFKDMPLIDLKKTLNEELDIVKHTSKFPEVQRNYNTYRTSINNRIKSSTQNVLEKDRIIDKIGNTIYGMAETAMTDGKYSPIAFVDRYVINGSTSVIEKVRADVIKKVSSKDYDPKFKGSRKDIVKAVDDGFKKIITDGIMQRADVVPMPENTFRGFDGVTYARTGIKNPTQIAQDLKSDNVKSTMALFFPQDHVQYLEDSFVYLSKQQEADVLTEYGAELNKLTGTGPLTKVGARAISTNEVISRGFNLARGMVSPAYVSAEFAFRLASMAGVDMMKVAAGDPIMAKFMYRIMKFPEQLTKLELSTFADRMTEFIVTEYARTLDQVPEFNVEYEIVGEDGKTSVSQEEQVKIRQEMLNKLKGAKE